jgi:2-amino-4-hydroxy-6-hydroxymethyldihydropteridine diphosphokinase
VNLFADCKLSRFFVSCSENLMEPSLISLGANLGRRKQQLLQAWNAINELDYTHTIRLSSFYETEPEGGPPNQPKYLNAAGLIETLLEPH